MNGQSAQRQFDARGFVLFDCDAVTAAWAQHAAGQAGRILADPAHDHWYRHRRSWFVGVDALENDGEGRLPGGPPLAGAAISFVREELGFDGPWHEGQVSVCFPGYPQKDEHESAAAHSFRKTRDAAHVDGLHGEGPDKRRHLREFHHFILGLPLTVTGEGAAPFVVWEGSHHIMREMFAAALAAIPPSQWSDADLTETYQAARRRAFETCPRVVLHAGPGEAYLVHRHALHGVAPWQEGAAAPPAGRAIAYFRPEMPDRQHWLHQP